MYYKCTKCQNEQTTKIKCDICQERTLYIIREYPKDIPDAKTYQFIAGLWKGLT